jgi:outer membrane receptor for ferrienterochelin and colicin
MTKRNALSMAILLGLAAAMPVAAQNTSAGVTGRVVDQSGAAVANATIEIVHAPTGARKTVTTDANGRYTVVGLRVGGPYTVTATKDGLKDAESDVYLALAEMTSVDAQLGSGEATELEAITVTADATMMMFSPDKMGTGTNVSREQIEAFPSIERNLQDYARLDPRVVQTDKSRNEISVGGQNPRYNSVRVDGISTNDSFGLESNNLPTPRQPFSMDTIDEIAVDVANYDVTISGGVGGVINAVTKSGTNEFHGSVYGLYRDNTWVAENADGSDFSGFTDETTYGLTVGGPIIKDKLFFFFNYEDYNQGAPGPTFGPVGSSASNIVGITQADIDRARSIAQGYGFDPGGFSVGGADTTGEEYGLKIDWNINDAHRFNFRYGISDQSVAVFPGFGSTQIALDSYSYQRDFELDTYTAQLFSDWTDSFSTEAKISYRDYSAVRTPKDELPSIAIRIGNNTLNLGTEENTHANVLATETWNSYLAGNWFLGDHTVKFGADYEDNEIYNLFGRRINGVYTFNSLDQFAAGVSSRYQLFYPAGGDIDNMAAVWGLRNLGLFVQDSWAFNNNLTLTYGFRVDTPSVDEDPVHNAAASAAFGYDNSSTIDGNRTVAPRLGFNYTFDSERPTQLRGGFGLFQGASASVWLSNPYSNNGLAYTDYLFSTGITQFDPDRQDQLGLFTPGTGGTQSIDFVDPALGQPSAWKANLAFDHELPWWGAVAAVEAILLQVEEGIYYEHLNLGAPTRYGQDGRAMFWNAAGYNRANWNQAGTSSGGASTRQNRLRTFNDAIIARPTNKGGSQQGTLSLTKPMGSESDWSWMASYTYTNADEVSPLTSSTSGSQWGNINTFHPNEEVNATSSYEIRDRFSAAISWKHDFFSDLDTTVSLFGESRSGKPFSYVFDNDANGDGRFGNDLLYIPTGPGDVLFGSAAEEAGFWAFVEGNDYLNSHRGQVATRNGDRGKQVNQFDVRISQELPGFFGDNKSELWVDILNIGNLLNDEWGQIDEVAFPGNLGVVEYGGIDTTTGRYVYRFNTPDTSRIYDDRGISRWSVQVGFRYQF